MNKKGFTLIELLAVIVILAIIALIATPIVLNIIKDSKDSATLQFAQFYIDAVETSVAKKIIDDPTFKPTSCEIQKDGNLKCGETDVKVEINGEKPTSGTIILKSGEIEDVELVLNEKTVVKNSEGKLVYNAVEPSEPLFKGTLAYSEETKYFLFESMVDFGNFKPQTNYKITLIDSNNEKTIIEKLGFYTNLEMGSVLAKQAEDSVPGIMCNNEVGFCAFMDGTLNLEQKYQVIIEEQDDKFIPYKFLLKKQNGSSSANLSFFTMNIEKGGAFNILIKDEDNNIYFNETNFFTAMTGNLVGNFSYNISTTHNSAINSLFEAVNNNKKITMILSFYDTQTEQLNGQVDEYVFESSDATCTAINSSNECVEYGWGNLSLLLVE